jgi:hypothetical protein
MVRANHAAVALIAVSALVATGTGGTVAGAAASPTRVHATGGPAAVQRLALRAGLQVGPKHSRRPAVTVAGRRYAAPDPALAELPSGTKVDLSYWRRHRAVQGQRRASARAERRSAAAPRPFVFHEREAMGRVGRNDDAAESEHLVDLGIGRRFQAVQVHGRISSPPIRTRRLSTREDQGSISLATSTGIGRAHPRAAIYSRVGDGPHGRAGDGHGDFDFYRLQGVARATISADTRGSRLDTVLVIYDSAGHIVASNDDENGESVTSALDYNVRRTGSYYLMVGGFGDRGSLPADPFRSGSGTGAGHQGAYRLHVTARQVDKDFYGVRLRSGDVLGGVLTGRAGTVEVHRVDRRTMVGSGQDASSAYPPQSPLPGGGATFAYVAEQPGWYAVSVQNGAGGYRLLLETYLPGTATSGVQTVFLDFDGARMNTAMFGGPGVVTLSPLRRFLARWGLARSAEKAVVGAAVASVRENIARTLQARGLHRSLKVRVLDSRDDADPFGKPNVSRVVVGGTMAESGVATVGISQSVDPGDYAHEESALVLLDEVSRPAGPADSLNTYLKPGSHRVRFVGQALGNLVAHEIGHLVGSFHTDSRDASVNLMDAGGASFGSFFGIGPDRVGGTADDTDVDFGVDAFSPDEGFTGLENTLNNSAWAFIGP